MIRIPPPWAGNDKEEAGMTKCTDRLLYTYVAKKMRPEHIKILFGGVSMCFGGLF